MNSGRTTRNGRELARFVELKEAVRRVKRAGLDICGPAAFGWMRAPSYYFYGPAGNLLVFWSPQPDKAHLATA